MGFEYLVCQMQFGRVTFANGEWQGSIRLGNGDSQAALDSCPQVWDYLSEAGRMGWELVAATNNAITHDPSVSQLTAELFLKRSRQF
jgi:hypothetical protein